MTQPDMMLFKTADSAIVRRNEDFFALDQDWDELVNTDALYELLHRVCESRPGDPSLADAVREPLAPIGSQEVWGAGVTYARSRTARMEESRASGGDDFYDRVYDAERPEIFFKATSDRVVGPGQALHLRRDSGWIVPEPELVLSITRNAAINGYTIGNDLSCRDIEGENPLYLPQAKTFDRCAGIGPGILVRNRPLDATTAIRLHILRGTDTVVEDATTIAQLKRSFSELVGYLFRDNHHRNGCLFMTGTGIVPDDVTLESGDVVRISIDGIGTLENPMD